jgi:hypothetical protein
MLGAIIGAAISAGSALFGASKQSKAIDRSNAAQQQAIEQSNAAALQARDYAQSAFAPYVESGNRARSYLDAFWEGSTPARGGAAMWSSAPAARAGARPSAQGASIPDGTVKIMKNGVRAVFNAQKGVFVDEAAMRRGAPTNRAAPAAPPRSPPASPGMTGAMPGGGYGARDYLSAMR